MSDPSSAGDRRVAAVRAREVLDCRGLPTVQVDLDARGRRHRDGRRALGPLDRRERGLRAARRRHRFGGFGVRDGGRATSAGRSPTRWSAAARLPAHARRGADRARRHRGQVAPRRQRDPRRLLGGRARRAPRRPACRSTARINANAHTAPGAAREPDQRRQARLERPRLPGVHRDPGRRRLDARGAADLDRGQPRARRDPARALRQGRPQHGRRGRLRARRSRDPREALGLLHEAVADAGYDGRFRYGLDCAATHYYDREHGTYAIAGETRDRDGDDRALPGADPRLRRVTIEDPLDEEDFDGLRAA